MKLSRIISNKETFYHGAVKQQRINFGKFGNFGIPSFWQNHTVDPPIPWEEWSDLFQLAIIAKEKIDIENLLNPSERYHPLPPTLENPPENESDAQKTSRIERNIREQKRFDDEEMASIKSETKKFNGMRLEEADKKLRSILYLALGNEGKKIFAKSLRELKFYKFFSKNFGKICP